MNQTNTVAALRMHPLTTQEEHDKLVLVQMEMERVKFIIRSYLRTRLFKVVRTDYSQLNANVV